MKEFPFDVHRILNAINEGMVIHDTDGRIVFVNDRACEFLGLSHDQIIGKTSMDPLWKMYKEDMTPFDGEDHPVSYTLVNQKPKLNVIMGVDTPKKVFRWIQINSHPLFEKEVFQGAVATFSDITQEREKNTLIKSQSQYIDIIFDSVPMILYAIDIDGIFTFSQGSGLSAIGLKDNQAVGQSVFDLYANVQEIIEKTKMALKGTDQHYQSNIGDRTYINHMVPQYNANDEISGLVGMSFDVTEQEKQKKLFMLQSRQAKVGEMLSVIAHQWRQPLSAISAKLIDMRLKLELKKGRKEDLISSIKEIEESIQYLSATITDFRDFFRPDKGKESVAVTMIVSSVLTLVQAVLNENNIQVQVHDNTKELKVNSYKNELIQVMLNLFHNVIDIVKSQNLNNTVILVESYIQEKELIIEVSDNAGGVNIDHIDDLFTPYFSTKHELQGTGLGLYMCKSIVEGHCGGSLTVFNRDQGAVFKIALPL